MSSEEHVMKACDMAPDMVADTVKTAAEAFRLHTLERDRAQHIKKEFDRKYGNTWHCIVGREFGSYTSHESKNFIYFSIGEISVLLFKAG